MQEIIERHFPLWFQSSGYKMLLVVERLPDGSQKFWFKDHEITLEQYGKIIEKIAEIEI